MTLLEVEIGDRLNYRGNGRSGVVTVGRLSRGGLAALDVHPDPRRTGSGGEVSVKLMEETLADGFGVVEAR